MNVYISCPIHINENTLKECIELVKKSGYTPNYWERGTHYDKSDVVKKCDIFVMFLPYGKFKCSYSELTTGCKLEFDTAVREKKPILIAYKSEEGVKIYTFAQYNKVNSGEPISELSGTARTGNYVLAKIKSNELANPGKTITVSADYTISIYPFTLPDSYKSKVSKYEFNCKLEDLYPKRKPFVETVESLDLQFKTVDGGVFNVGIKKMNLTEYDRRLLLLLS